MRTDACQIRKPASEGFLIWAGVVSLVASHASSFGFLIWVGVRLSLADSFTASEGADFQSGRGSQVLLTMALLTMPLLTMPSLTMPLPCYAITYYATTCYATTSDATTSDATTYHATTCYGSFSAVMPTLRNTS